MVLLFFYSAADAERFDKVQVIEEVDYSIMVEVCGWQAETEGIDKIEVVEEIGIVVAVEIGRARCDRGGWRRDEIVVVGPICRHHGVVCEITTIVAGEIATSWPDMQSGCMEGVVVAGQEGKVEEINLAVLIDIAACKLFYQFARKERSATG